MEVCHAPCSALAADRHSADGAGHRGVVLVARIEPIDELRRVGRRVNDDRPPLPTPPLRQWLNLSYAHKSSAEKLDLYAPTSHPAPAGGWGLVVYVHGARGSQGWATRPTCSP